VIPNQTTTTQPKGSGFVYRMQALLVVVLSLLPWLVPLSKTTTPNHDNAWSSSASDGPSLRATSPSPNMPSGPTPVPALLNVVIVAVAVIILVGVYSQQRPRVSQRLWLWQRRLLL
jgi:hypothetical protein